MPGPDTPRHHLTGTQPASTGSSDPMPTIPCPGQLAFNFAQPRRYPADLTGETFLCLTVTGLAARKGKVTYWHCRCVCGNTTVAERHNLTRGHTRSCGCAPFRKPPRRKPIEARLAAKIVKIKDGCWEWRPVAGKRAYGCIWVNGKTRLVHRVMWEITRNKSAEGLVICHRCDNPSCIRPDHLFAGNQRDNLRDMIRKNRHNWQRSQGILFAPSCPAFPEATQAATDQ